MRGWTLLDKFSAAGGYCTQFCYSRSVEVEANTRPEFQQYTQ
jgi:hypothetical protein